MKTTIITLLMLCISFITLGQELKHQEIKSKLYTAVEANFPVRFNSIKSFRQVFYQKCDRFPKHCQKLKFDTITDFRIIEIIAGHFEEEVNEIDFVPPKYYRINASLDFAYSAENISHYGTAILECTIKKIIDGYEIDYIKIKGRKSMHEYYEPIQDPEYYVLNRLDINK